MRPLRRIIPARARPSSPARRKRGLVLIIGYKLVKGVLWLAFAVALLVLMRFGLDARVLGLADHLRHHAGAWSVALGKLVAHAASRRGLFVIIVALIADGVASLVEGWALVHGRWWGPWLVVVTTASLLPFEVMAFVRHRHAARAAVFFANAAIVWYLARTELREHRERLALPKE
jgi:uncharacterized membrane protein (DUF2068 family)